MEWPLWGHCIHLTLLPVLSWQSTLRTAGFQLTWEPGASPYPVTPWQNRVSTQDTFKESGKSPQEKSLNVNLCGFYTVTQHSVGLRQEEMFSNRLSPNCAQSKGIHGRLWPSLAHAFKGLRNPESHVISGTAQGSWVGLWLIIELFEMSQDQILFFFFVFFKHPSRLLYV